jgi:hypothetical protein
MDGIVWRCLRAGAYLGKFQLPGGCVAFIEGGEIRDRDEPPCRVCKTSEPPDLTGRLLIARAHPERTVLLGEEVGKCMLGALRQRALHPQLDWVARFQIQIKLNGRSESRQRRRGFEFVCCKIETTHELCGVL